MSPSKRMSLFLSWVISDAVVVVAERDLVDGQEVAAQFDGCTGCDLCLAFGAGDLTLRAATAE